MCMQKDGRSEERGDTPILTMLDRIRENPKSRESQLVMAVRSRVKVPGLLKSTSLFKCSNE